MSHTEYASDIEKNTRASGAADYANGGYAGGQQLHHMLSTDTQVCTLIMA